MKEAVTYGADLLILDLEDSVPNNEVAARAIVKEALNSLKKKGQACLQDCVIDLHFAKSRSEQY